MNKEKRLEIGKLLYDGKMTNKEAVGQFHISYATARNYMREYRDENGLPPPTNVSVYSKHQVEMRVIGTEEDAQKIREIIEKEYEVYYESEPYDCKGNSKNQRWYFKMTEREGKL